MMLSPLVSAWSRPDCRGHEIPSGNDSVFQVGEELTYNVSYAFIDIGQVRIKVMDRIQKDGKTLYKAMAYIDSYKGVPFVDLHSTYESLVSESLYSKWFRARMKEDDSRWRSFTYDFDYPSDRVLIEVGEEKTQVVDRRDTLSINSLYQDGLSLFYFARGAVSFPHVTTAPVVVSEKKATTYLDVKNGHKGEKIDAVKYPVDVTYFEGRGDFVGIFGLTGEFEGWFSSDAAHVPILAKMKVIIGNVRLELMKWKRAGWDPPQYVEESDK